MATIYRCSDCGTLLSGDASGAPGRPCFKCGSTTRTIEKEPTASGAAVVEVSLTVQQALEAINATRIGAFFFMLAAAFSVGASVGTAAGAAWGLGAGLVAALLAAALVAGVYRVAVLRNAVMRFMHYLTGE